MSPSPPAKTYLELQRLARETGEGSTQQLFELYLHERFLARLSVSEYRYRFVLKGGMLLAGFDIRRPTRDADVLAINMPSEEIELVLSEIVRIDLRDGVKFDPAQLRSDPIRNEADYPGMRITVPSRLDRARLNLYVDVNFADPVEPEEIEFPTLLDHQPIYILGYPIESVIAEKVETMMALGDANTRMRDYADVFLLSRRHPIEARTLHAALQATSVHRGRKLRPLRTTLFRVDERQIEWNTFRRRHPGLRLLPENFEQVVSAVIAFIDPALDRYHQLKWNPITQSWE